MTATPSWPALADLARIADLSLMHGPVAFEIVATLHASRPGGGWNLRFESRGPDADARLRRSVADAIKAESDAQVAARIRARTAAIDPGVDRGPVVGPDPAMARLGREVDDIYERAGEVLAAQMKGDGNG